MAQIHWPDITFAPVNLWVLPAWWKIHGAVPAPTQPAPRPAPLHQVHPHLQMAALLHQR